MNADPSPRRPFQIAVDRPLQPAYAAQALEALLDARSTHATLTTDADGNAPLRASLGTVDVTAALGNANVQRLAQLPHPGQAVNLQFQLTS